MPDSEVHPRIFRFGIFEFDGRTGELRKDGKARPRLQGQPLEVLLFLLGRPGEVVPREEIRQKLWPADTFVDYDHSLNTSINKLREALGDSAENPRFIQTVPRRGYRFIASVEAISQEAKFPAPENTSTQTALTGAEAGSEEKRNLILSDSEDLPAVPRGVVRTLFGLLQLMYLGFYVFALVDLHRVELLLSQILPHPKWYFAVFLVTALAGIPVRLYLLAAIAFGYPGLREKFRRLFPFLLLLDEIWALTPLLLFELIGIGLALAATAALLYVPFSQRSLLLMRPRHSHSIERA